MITVKVRGKLKKIYDTGGDIPYAQAGQFAGDLVDTVYQPNKYGVKPQGAAIGSGALKGAGTGAAIGTQILPGWGTAIGAVVGAGAGAISSGAANKKQMGLQNQYLTQQNQFENSRTKSILNSYDKGTNDNQIYAKYGGALPIKYVDGGNLKGLSEENEEVQGDSHAEGGVQLSPDVEVEGGETINTEGKEPFVFSDKLGFAKLHKPIARAIGKLEKKVSNNITNDTIKLLKQKEAALKQHQEQFKEALGLKGISEYELGGNIKKQSPYGESKSFVSIDNKLYRIPKR